MGRILLISTLIIVTLQAWTTTSAISLEDAKKLTASMTDEEVFVPPPRRIDDITNILNQPGKFNKSATMKFKSKADSVPPAGESKQGLAAFYRDRAIAAWQLGRYNQTIEDSAMAEQYAEEAGIMDPDLKHRLAVAEMDTGKYRRAIQLLEENIKKSNYIASYQMLVSAYTLTGDIDAAKKTKQDAIKSCETKQTGRGGAKRARRSELCEIMKVDIEARILESQGKYAEAEQYIHETIRRTMALQFEDTSPGTILRRKLWLARNLFLQERFFESEIATRDVLNASLGHGGQESSQTLSSLLSLSSCLAVQGRIEEAEKLFSLAVNILESSGFSNDSRIAGQIRSNYGVLLTAKSDFKGAMEQFNLIKSGLQENHYIYEKIFAKNPSLLLSLLMTGHAEEAMSLIKRRYENLKTVLGERNFNTALMLALRGMAYSRMGNIEQAVKDLSGSVDTLMEYSTEKGSYLKNQQVKIIIQDYMQLLEKIYGTHFETELQLDAAGLMFKLSEMMRGQTVQNALLASSARGAETDPEIINMIRQEQDSLKQIDVIEAAILENIAAPSDQQNPQLIKSLHAKLNTLRQARIAILEELKKRSKKYAYFVSPQFPLPSSIQKHLHHREALVSIYTTDNRTYIWAIPQTGHVRYASVPVSQKGLEKIVASLRESLDSNPLTLKDIPLFNTDSAYELYRTLLLPVKDGWKDAQNVLFIVNEPLSRIPLAVITTEPFKSTEQEKIPFEQYKKTPWFIRHASITMAPSASSFIALRILPMGKPHKKMFVGFGDPIFSLDQFAMSEKESSAVQVRSVRLTNRGGLDNAAINSSRLENLQRLPDTAEELKAIAAILKADALHDVFLGKNASRSTVKTMDLSDRQIVAFATHALVPGELDGLDQPALALSSPAVTGKKEDGLLTMGDIMKLKLNADWIVLSACNTGAAEGSGAEALSGLGKAFFYAGTRAVLATMYPVETTSAKKLTIDLFRNRINHKEHTRAQALQKAMLDLINDPGYIDPGSKKIGASYAHPLFWAPFVLYGEGGD
ncbi:MAG: CHAT domain-containing protein [Proteobacteria bacterium]|nr:CHAT domain-containing protein [Pseudomonadota bacterium]